MNRHERRNYEKRIKKEYMQKLKYQTYTSLIILEYVDREGVRVEYYYDLIKNMPHDRRKYLYGRVITVRDYYIDATKNVKEGKVKTNNIESETKLTFRMSEMTVGEIGQVKDDIIVMDDILEALKNVAVKLENDFPDVRNN